MRTPEELEAFVKKMRELGVAECDGIRLGPSPALASARAIEPEELLARQQKIEERQRDIMFAASHVKPRLRMVKK